MTMMKSTAHRTGCSVTADDLIVFDDDLMVFTDPSTTVVQQSLFPSPVSEDNHSSPMVSAELLIKTMTLESGAKVLREADKSVMSTPGGIVGDFSRMRFTPATEGGTQHVAMAGPFDRMDDEETRGILDEQFDCEIRTPEAMSDSEDAPVKTLMDSPMSFTEKIRAARKQLKEHVERSGMKEMDDLFAMLRVTPGGGFGSSSNSSNTSSTYEAMDFSRSQPQKPAQLFRSNSLLRRRPESFANAPMADLARKVQEQEKALLEGAKEVARRLELKRISPQAAVLHQTPIVNVNMSPTVVVPCRLTFEKSPEVVLQQVPQPKTLPRPGFSFLPQSKITPTFKAPDSDIRSPTKATAVPALSPSKMQPFSTVVPKPISSPGTLFASMRALLPPPRLPQILPAAQPFSSASIRVTHGQMRTNRPGSASKGAAEPLRATNQIIRTLPLQTDPRFALPPAMAESVARLSAPKCKTPSPPKLYFAAVSPRVTEPVVTSSICPRTAKTPSPPKCAETAKVKRRLSFLPSPSSLSVAKKSNGIVNGDVMTPSIAPVKANLARRPVMTQKALAENLPHRQPPPCSANVKPTDLADQSVLSSRKLTIGDGGGDARATTTNNENILLNI